MKKFKFRLEKVLQYRHIVQDEKKRAVHDLMIILNEAERALENFENAFMNNNVTDGAVFTIEELSIRGAYSERLKQQIAQKKLDIFDIQERLDVARAEYVEARKEVEVLEKLKEKKREQYDEVIALHEQKFLDELVTQRSARVSKE